MPRRNRLRREDQPRARPQTTTAAIPAPAGWRAKQHKGGEPGTPYVCPRCHRDVRRESAHVVAWQASSDDDPATDAILEQVRRGGTSPPGEDWSGRGRHRHWHTECWRSAVHEGLHRYDFS